MELIVTTKEQLRAFLAEEIQGVADQVNLRSAKMARPWLTKSEVVEYTGFSTSKIDTLVRDGLLKKYFIASQPVYYREDLDQLPAAKLNQE